MTADVLIVGQGLAGTLLGWELERAGISFEVIDSGEAGASAVAAGIVNPITGRRLVKSWEVERLLPMARATYAEIGDALGVRLWHAMRVRREFADTGERATFAAKKESGELAPFVGGGDDAGFWIEGAGRVELVTLISAVRAHWQRAGRWRKEIVNVAQAVGRHQVVMDCRGVAAARGGGFSFVPWEFSKGEVLTIATEGLRPDVILNRRHWIAPVGARMAWVGATHEPGRTDTIPTAGARELLLASARAMMGAEPTVTDQRVGVRVNLPDKRPVVGRHPEQPALGVMSGLGAKGALVGPWLARMWADHLIRETKFDPAVDVARFWRRDG